MNPPLYLRLADNLERMIAKRSLRSGDRIPSVRQFSREQRVSVPTALNAFAALESRGLIEARPKSGFFVRAMQIDTIPVPVSVAPKPSVCNLAGSDPFEILSQDQYNPDLVQFGSALPSPELLPGVKLGRILSSVARSMGASGTNYDGGAGNFSLRREISRRLLSAGCSLGPDDLLITSGATEAVSIALRATCRPGDTVAVESPTFFGILRQMRELGLNALPIPVDPANGMDLDVLAQALRRTRISACLINPNFQNPIGFVMPEDRKRELLRLATSHGFPIIEDDIYSDIPHRGPRPHALKALDTDGSVLLCGSLSKTLAPGYRIGHLAPGRWLQRAGVLKKASTLSGVTLTAAAAAEFLRSGGYDRFLRTYRDCCRSQVEQMREAIGQTFPEGVRVTRPQGGYILWCELPPGVDSLNFFHQARAAGIALAPGPLFSSKGNAQDYLPPSRAAGRRPGKSTAEPSAVSESFLNCIRINCGYPWSPKIERAVGVLGHLAHTLAASASSAHPLAQGPRLVGMAQKSPRR